MPDVPTPPGETGRAESVPEAVDPLPLSVRIAEAMHNADCGCKDYELDDEYYDMLALAAMTVVEPVRARLRATLASQADEIAALRRERDLAIAHDTQPYPTADAYERACAALRKHKERADAAEATAARLHDDRDVLAAVGRLYLDSLDADPENEMLTLGEAYRVTAVREAVDRWEADHG